MNNTALRKNITIELALYSLLIALVFVGTYVIQIPMPWSNGGLVHVGDVVLFTIALVFGKKKGAVAGGFGMALFDILSPWAVWAPFTLVIRAAMGYIIGKVAFADSKKGKDKVNNILGILLSLPVLIGGYYIAEALLYGNWITPVKSISGNLIQFAVGIVGSLPLVYLLNAIPYVNRLKALED